MDSETLKFYKENAEEIFTRYESVSSGIAAYFLASFPYGCTVADVGAGSGRDTRKLLELGYDAIGIEPSDALRKIAISHHPELANRLLEGFLPKLRLPKPVDGIVCSAVLMHIPENQLFDSLLSLRDALNLHGRLLLSIPKMRPELDGEYRDAQRRLFQPIVADRLVLLGERLGLRLVSRWENPDALQRPDHEWITLLFEKTQQAGRPLDRIESVLNRDRKVATYKLALLRGLCDLASADDHFVDWSNSNEVGIPLRSIAERWLFYYWPLFSAPEFIPQIQAEDGESSKQIKFRSSLSALISHYHNLGGLDAFSLDYRSSNLDMQARKLLEVALRDIRSTIVQGPVTHSGQGGMFRYDKANQRVYCDAGLWQEFCLTGYWIRDALLLRWCELTIKFAPHISRGVVLEHLLREPVIEREVSLARQCYLRQPDLRCVWSDMPLQPQTLAVDHALPFALWRNNDLWNLLPSHQKINGKKSDKVPTPTMLTNRKDAIVHYWEILYFEETDLFKSEIHRLLGDEYMYNWENKLFEYLKRNSEYGIFLRGATPWEII